MENPELWQPSSEYQAVLNVLMYLRIERAKQARPAAMLEPMAGKQGVGVTPVGNLDHNEAVAKPEEADRSF